MTKAKATIDETKSIEAQEYIPGVSFVALVFVLTLLQGGFYAEAYCVVGIAIVVIALITYVIARRRYQVLHVPASVYLFLGIAISALVGSWLAGLNASFITESAIWPFAAAAAVLSAFIFKGARAFVFDLLGWAGVVSACLAILMFAGILPFEGAENMGRLQFTFQYANAAGIWFAVMAVLAITSDAKRLRILAFFPIVALLFTQSVGAVAVFVIASVAVLVRWGRKRAAARVWALLMQLLCAFAVGGVQIALVASALLSPVIALAGFVLLVLLRRFLGPALEEREVSSRTLLAISLGLFVLGIVAGIVVLAFTGRFPQATQTFIERILQTQDAFELLKQGFVFGTGPGSWSYLYQEVQTIQYTASVVHNSFAQVALDSGIIGLILFLIVVVRGFLLLGKAKDWRVVLLAAMMTLHFLIDFDLQFASLLMLFMLFIVPSQDEASPSAHGEWLSLVSVIAVSILCLCGCAMGLWVQVQKDEVFAYAQERDWELVEQRLEDDPLLALDPEMRALYLQILINQAEYSKAALAYHSLAHTTANEATLAAYALYQAGCPLEAEEVLVEKLFQQPKNYDYFNDVAEILSSQSASASAIERYEDATLLANQQPQGLGSFMTNQKEVPATLDDYLAESLPITE